MGSCLFTFLITVISILLQLFFIIILGSALRFVCLAEQYYTVYTIRTNGHKKCRNGNGITKNIGYYYI